VTGPAAGAVVFPFAGGRLAVCATTLPGAPAGERRRAEHLGGRRALTAGLTALGVPGGPLGRRADGSPAAPEGTLVSVSHRFPHVVAVAWRSCGSGRLAGLGVDLESAGTIPHDAFHLVSGPDELAGLDNYRDSPDWRDPTRVFSAKEAAFKADPHWRSQPFAPRRIRLRPTGPRLALATPGKPAEQPTGTGGRARQAATTSVVASRRFGDHWLSLCAALRTTG
jgi:hypothetical protein